MLHLLTCSKTGEVQESTDIVKVREALANPSVNFWVDIEEPTDDEIDLLLEDFKFHPLAVEDVVLDVSIPKLDVYEGYAFLNLHRVFYNFETENCDRRDFEVFFSNRYIVTVHEKNLSRTFARTRDKIKEAPRKTLAIEPSYVLLKLLELAARDYQPVMEEWQETLENIEHQVLRGQEDKILDQILRFKKLVATMRKSLLPEREVIRNLYESPALTFISNKARPYFKSAVDDFNALLQDLESLRDHANNVFDVYAAVLTMKMTESSNKLNFVMQRLTIATTIFLPLTFIVGVYGMNFKYMPELQWEGFYFVVWGFMIALVIGMIWFFKKKQWL
jgi:magnesium Mg(2+) and cobalt Co(2+) transport protein (corA)